MTGSATYGAFGNRVATSGSSTSAYLFAATSGYRDDGDAGLMHVGARYYDAEVGRFISRDSYLDQKAYLYCEHEPVNRLDPNGHRPPSYYELNGENEKLPRGPGEITITPTKRFWAWVGIVAVIIGSLEGKKTPGKGAVAGGTLLVGLATDSDIPFFYIDYPKPAPYQYQ